MSVVTPASAAKNGLSRSGLYRAARAGRYDRIARGVYLSSAAVADWDLVEAAARRPDATICLISALVQHDLSDAIPESLDVAIPRGARPPATKAAIAWHHFDVASFELGRVDMVIPGVDLSIGIYSPERCIADAFRLRGQFGYETARDALKEWLRRGGKPADLMAVAARLPRARTPVLQALEVLA